MTKVFAHNGHMRVGRPQRWEIKTWWGEPTTKQDDRRVPKMRHPKSDRRGGVRQRTDLRALLIGGR